jgi:hypothetical protein
MPGTNTLNPSRKLVERPHRSLLLNLLMLAGLVAGVALLRAVIPPTFLFQWAGWGSNNSYFNYPSGIAIDSSNNVYVADNGSGRVQKFDGNGNYFLPSRALIAER